MQYQAIKVFLKKFCVIKNLAPKFFWKNIAAHFPSTRVEDFLFFFFFWKIFDRFLKLVHKFLKKSKFLQLAKIKYPVRMLHTVNAWAGLNKISLGQVKTEERSNEIVDIPEILDLLFVEKSIVTIATKKDSEWLTKLFAAQQDRPESAKKRENIKSGEQGKRLKAGWDSNYFKKLLNF